MLGTYICNSTFLLSGFLVSQVLLLRSLQYNRELSWLLATPYFGTPARAEQRQRWLAKHAGDAAAGGAAAGSVATAAQP